ncbi:ABC transporter ATP-binding protein [Pontibacter akesuensis]|uniref:ABC-2 type transport system ATP-binding protein n=1 Tax=Pontibacter akesuensis TaxID=388950 RepID=A0A1I7K315_9BACT|nr:ABC transporter ATP-binding protein [Pontibacter akesuensis]GHA75468.1 ATP-binding protein [Pontibacter akesuensis]SFU91817.1 ABC-2 type transport system ATP-binding protein [Pontibacter akesuensis]
MIEVRNIEKSYNGKVVVNIPALTVNAGEAVGLVGNNGAGKTTLFRMVLDLIRPSKGEVFLKDVNVAQSEVWKSYTGSHLDDGFLIDYLTAEEFFKFIGDLHGLTEGDITERLLPFMDFFNDEILNQRKYIRDFSKGNQKKIGVAAAALSNPELLILDEPFANLDPSSQIRLKNLLRNMREQKRITMFISSHDLSHVIEVCERIVILDKGQLVQDMQTNENTLRELETYFTV